MRPQGGELYIDNRNNPGFDDATAVAAGLPVGAGRGVFESATFTCKHCQAVVVYNPRNDQHQRCRGCGNGLLCNGCGAVFAQTRECKSFERQIAEILAKAS